MKLYLSSHRTGNQEAILVEMVGKGGVITLIPNAIDFIDNKEIVEGTGKTAYEISLAKDIDKLKSLGFKVEILDLREYFGKQEALQERMSSVKCVYVRGGNAFLLRRAFEDSGFDEELNARKNDEGFVYAGYSAGVVVLAPSLKGIDKVDDPNIKVEGYKDGIIWEGLGILKHSIAPHHDPEWRKNEKRHPDSENIDKVVQFFQDNGIEYVGMRDGEVLVIDTKTGMAIYYGLEGIKPGPEK